MSTKTSGAARVRVRPRRTEVRRRLLDAATRLFAERGIIVTSIDDIAAAAGFTKGAFYSNFTSKENLILELIDDQTASRLDWGQEAFQAGSQLAGERAEALGDRLTAIFVAHREWQMLFLEFWQQAVRSPEVGRRFGARRREMRAAVAAAIQTQAESLGVTLALAPEQLATVILALSNGLAIERYADEEAVPDHLFGDVLRLLLTARPDAADSSRGPSVT
jgi:AcrR family transcriptional regulator